MRGQNVEVLNVKLAVYSYHWELKVLNINYKNQ